jgi:glyceraldehyde-3-phosphate dehydrogenase/erythrose-4-phosphate dehydrogenase
MKVAIVGTGLIGNVHAQAIKGLGHEIVVAVNSSMLKAEAFAAQWSVPTFGTDFQLALTEEVDCVHICTPPALHFAMIKAALLANKHVVCEKPMCLEVQEAQEVYELAQQLNRVVAVVFNVRYHQACMENPFGTWPLFARISCLTGCLWLEVPTRVGRKNACHNRNWFSLDRFDALLDRLGNRCHFCQSGHLLPTTLPGKWNHACRQCQ